MKRRVVAVIVFLLLGAIVNIAVAWGFEIVVPFSLQGDSGQVWENNRSNVWSFVVDSEPGSLWVTSMRMKTKPESLNDLQVLEAVHERQLEAWGAPRQRVPRWSGLREPAEEFSSAQLDREFRIITAHGWPALALFAELRNPESIEQQFMRHYVQSCTHRGWVVPNWTNSSPRPFLFLPLGLIWPGFAINTLFYAVILWLLFAGSFALRRWRRIKRGLCPACGYPVGTSSVCTECGKPVNAG